MNDKLKLIIALVTAVTALITSLTSLVKALDKTIEQTSYEVLSAKIVELQKELADTHASQQPDEDPLALAAPDDSDSCDPDPSTSSGPSEPVVVVHPTAKPKIKPFTTPPGSASAGSTPMASASAWLATSASTHTVKTKAKRFNEPPSWDGLKKRGG